MYALDLAHAMVWHMIWSWSFANLFDKPGQVEWQVDPNTNLLNLVNFKCQTFHVPILIIGFEVWSPQNKDREGIRKWQTQRT